MVGVPVLYRGIEAGSAAGTRDGGDIGGVRRIPESAAGLS